MKKFLFSSLLALAAVSLLVCPALAAKGTITIADQSGTGTTFDGANLQSLTATINLPKKLGAYKFDFLQATVNPSSVGSNKGGRNFEPSEVEELADSKEIAVDLLNDFYLNGYKMTAADYTTTPQSMGVSTLTVKVELRAYKQIGIIKDTKWDDRSQTWVTTQTPTYDKGVALASGSFTVTQPADKVATDGGASSLKNQLSGEKKPVSNDVEGKSLDDFFRR